MKEQKNLADNAASPFRLQFRLSTVLLLIAAVTIWFSYWNAKTASSKLESALPQLFQLLQTETLQVDDPNLYAAVMVPKQFLLDVGDEIWEVYLPPRTADGTPVTYELLLSTRLVSLQPPKTSAQTVPEFAVDIEAGLHHIQLVEEKQASGEMKIEILLDGLSAISVVKPDGWRKFKSVSQKIKQRKQLSIDQALEITTRQFMVRKTTAPRSWSPSKIPSAGIKVSIRQKGSYGKIE